MKAVILAGGLGSRISEETHLKPKPMIEIGGKPILWHIMKIYSHYGINEFIICCGYKGYVIKEYFSNYFMHMADITFDLVKNDMEIHQMKVEPWKVTLVDTGENTMTGGRLKRIFEYIKEEEIFCLTYGDGVADVNIQKLIKFHKKNGMIATLTAAYAPAKYGALSIKEEKVLSFTEKPQGEGGLINGGFFVMSPRVINLIKDDETMLEREPIEKLAADRQLGAFIHKGFWQSMDTLRDKNLLEDLWINNEAPWKVWK